MALVSAAAVLGVGLLLVGDGNPEEPLVSIRITSACGISAPGPIPIPASSPPGLKNLPGTKLPVSPPARGEEGGGLAWTDRGGRPAAPLAPPVGITRLPAVKERGESKIWGGHTPKQERSG